MVVVVYTKGGYTTLLYKMNSGVRDAAQTGTLYAGVPARILDVVRRCSHEIG